MAECKCTECKCSSSDKLVELYTRHEETCRGQYIKPISLKRFELVLQSIPKESDSEILQFAFDQATYYRLNN